MRTSYKCQKCGHKNYSTKEDIDKRREGLAPIPYIDEGSGFIKESGDTFFGQNIKEGMELPSSILA